MSRGCTAQRAVVALLLSAALSSCGTTVPLAERGSTPQGEAGQLAPLTAGPSHGPGATGEGPSSGEQTVAPSQADTTVGSPGSPGQPGGDEPTASSSTRPVASLAGPGFTKDAIFIGVGVSSDSDAFAGSLGVSGTGGGDQAAQQRAVADDINKRGGLLGRKLVLVPHSYSTAQAASDPASVNTGACATWTQDHRVYAVLMPLVTEDTLLACLAKAHTPLLNVGGGIDYPLHYESSYRRYPSFFNLAQMVGDRYDRISIDRLKQRRFFTPWDTVQGKPGTAAVTVGLVGFDDPDGALQITSQRAQLKANGITVADTNVIRCPRALAQSVNCYQSAVLRFSSAGVTHVFGVALLFMNQAQSQGYHPRYFVANSARVLAENAPAEQLEGAMAESYIPSYDVETSEYPGDPSPATADCRRIMRNAGIDISQPSVLFNALMVCDAFFYLKAGISTAGTLGPGALVTGLEGLSSRQQSTLTWVSSLAPGDHTTAHALRDLTYRKAQQRWFYDDRTNRS